MGNPGPGKYTEKKKNDIKAKILNDETVKVPFNISDQRDCIRPLMKSNMPGPGAYIDINNPHNSSVAKPMLKYQNDRAFSEAHDIKLAPFGGNEARFRKSEFEGKEGPGPGDYENSVRPTTTATTNGYAAEQRAAVRSKYLD